MEAQGETAVGASGGPAGLCYSLYLGRSLKFSIMKTLHPSSLPVLRVHSKSELTWAGPHGSRSPSAPDSLHRGVCGGSEVGSSCPLH